MSTEWQEAKASGGAKMDIQVLVGAPAWRKIAAWACIAWPYNRNERAPPQRAHSPCRRMKCKIDSKEGRARYGQRFATMEPVFGNLRHDKQLNRFTLRGRTKIDTHPSRSHPVAVKRRT